MNRDRRTVARGRGRWRPSAALLTAVALAWTAVASGTALLALWAGETRREQLVVLALPVALAALPVALPSRYRGGRVRLRVAAAVMLAVWIVLTLPSVGLLYLPAAALMVLAALRDGDAGEEG